MRKATTVVELSHSGFLANAHFCVYIKGWDDLRRRKSPEVNRNNNNRWATIKPVLTVKIQTSKSYSKCWTSLTCVSLGAAFLWLRGTHSREWKSEGWQAAFTHLRIHKQYFRKFCLTQFPANTTNYKSQLFYCL